jgi:integrase
MSNCKTVILRERPKKGGMLSMYLDFYPEYRNPETGQRITRYSLGIYIYANPKSKREKLYNEQLREKAEAVRCQVYQSIVNENYNLFDESMMRADFLAYYKSYVAKKDQKWRYVYKHFEKFCGGKCNCGDITVNFCNRFREYLLNANDIRKKNRQLSINSISGYWSTFRAFLKIAYINRKIKENVNDRLEKIKSVQAKKDSLTLNEFYKLVKTDCEIPILRKASIFACLTGLRRSDVLKLEWDNIQEYADGRKYIQFVAQKTKTETIVPISDELYNFIGPVGDGLVFKGLNVAMCDKPLKKWIKQADIKKHITFHGFRHSFASLQVELGTNIYTVQSMLGHKSVTTTQIYARHANPELRDAATKIPLFENNEA